MSEQPVQSNSLTADPELVIENLTTQLAAKAIEAANNWSGMQQVNRDLQNTRAALVQATAELEALRAQLNEEKPFVPDEPDVVVDVPGLRGEQPALPDTGNAPGGESEQEDVA